jgi:hypothetical protein
MKTNLKRRDFIIKGACAGISGCLFLSGVKPFKLYGLSMSSEEKPDPKKLNYCGYRCPDNCQFLKATLENNTDLKKEAFKLWEIEERFGVKFSPDEIFCYGCKTKDKPDGVVLVNCTVRSCVISKGLDCCIECGELAGCNKDLWKRFPEFKNAVLEMQKQYDDKGLQ